MKNLKSYNIPVSTTLTSTISSICAFLYLTNPSLKFIYKNSLINIIPFFFFILVIILSNNYIFKKKLLSPFLLISLFFSITISSFFFNISGIEFKEIFRIISLYFAFIAGLILFNQINTRLLIIFLICWCISLALPSNMNIINYHDGKDFNHLNFTLPLAMLVSWLIFYINLKNKINFIFTLLLLIPIIYLSINIIFAGSRAAIVVPLFIATIYSLLLFNHINKKRMISFMILFSITIIISLPIIINKLSSYFLYKLSTMSSNIEDDSRYQLYKKLYYVLQDFPQGIGYHNYSLYIMEPYPHNFFLEIALNSGILSSLLLLLFIVYYLLKSIKLNRTRKLDIKNLIPLIFFSYFLLSWQLSNDFGSSAPLFFSLGLLVSSTYQNNEEFNNYE
ncbi:TPA: O-antigen ligase family protein [Proteus mirabilis]